MLRCLFFDRSILFAAAAAILAASAAAQTCDTLLGGTNCAVPGSSRIAPGPTDQQRGGGFSMQSLGRDLSPGGDQPGYFAGITFGGAGVKCSGLFRSRDCLR